jgi:hypothetical protein
VLVSTNLIRRLAILSIMAVLLGLASPPASAAAAEGGAVRVLLLNGNTGKPMTGVGLNISLSCSGPCVTADGTKLSMGGGAANAEGVIDLPFIPGLRALRPMMTNSNFKYCQDSADHGVAIAHPGSFAADEILRIGVVAPNTCNRFLRIAPQPGQLVFFLRELTAWEQLTRPPQM